MKQTNRTLSLLLAILMLFSAATTAFAAGTLTLESATIDGTALAQATEIRSNAEILLTFSANVTDDSVLAFNIGKVHVKDSSGNNVSSVTVSKSGTKKLTVVLGSIERAAYTLTIGKEFKDINGNTLGQKVEIPFAVTKGDGTGNKPLNFGGATVGGTNLNGAVLAGTELITLQFDHNMQPYETANAALIGVYKADGTKAAYTILPVDTSSDTTKRQIQIQLNGLADGSYTLKIGAAVTAKNGNPLGEDVSISFTVKDKDADRVNFIRNLLDTIADLFRKVIDFFKGLLNK